MIGAGGIDYAVREFDEMGGLCGDMAKDEEAIVQIMGMGPVKTVQLEADRQTDRQR
jgi:phosphoenolpyruvate-protein kinase (PTS system EI component)